MNVNSDISRLLGKVCPVGDTYFSLSQFCIIIVTFNESDLIKMKDEQPKYFHLFGLNFPFRRSVFLGLLIRVWIAGGALLLVSMLLFGYEMTNSDIPCGLIAGVLLAYLISLWMD